MFDFKNITYDAVCTHAAQFRLYPQVSEKFYSLAEHMVILSIYVERFAREGGWTERFTALASKTALLHYATVEIEQYFEVQPTTAVRDLVLEVSRRLIVDEQQAIHVPAHMQMVGVPPLGASIACMPWQQAAVAFTQRFAELWPDWADEARAAIWREEVRQLGEGMS